MWLQWVLPGMFLAACSGSVSAEVAEEDVDRVRFEAHRVPLGFAGRPAVLTGRLLGGDMADLAVVARDGDERRLRIFAHDGETWRVASEHSLHPGVQFVDVARIGGRERLLTYRPGRLSWFDTEAGRERELLSVPVEFRSLREREVPHVDLTHDLNRDGRDDLALPQETGFLVFVQLADGVFSDPVRVGGATDLSRITGAHGYRYDPWSQSRVHRIDYDRDGRDDLAFWDRDRFRIHVQREDGRFSADPRELVTSVQFETDDFSSLATGAMTGRVLYALDDMNEDGTVDLVVYVLEGKRDARKRSRFEIHFGQPTPDGGTQFAAEIGATLRTKGNVQIALDRPDLDGDGVPELLLTTARVESLTGSLWKSLKGFMGDDIGLGLEFYRSPRSVLRSSPDTTRGLGLDGSPSHREPGSVPLDILIRGATHEARRSDRRWPRAFNVNSFLGDVTGDGRADLLIESSFRGLDAFAGVSGPDVFSKDPQRVEVLLPNDEEYSWLVDVNGDGKLDILLHHPFTDRDIHGGPRRRPGSEPHWVNVMVAH